VIFRGNEKMGHVLEVIDIWKTYEGQPLLKGVSFSIKQGETICLLGRSGSGKSTLLRIIAGLETPEQGKVLWEGRDLAEVPVHKRNFGLMFQDYALFPHRTVAENVAFGLRMQNLPRKEIEQRVREALKRINMEAFANRRVTDLSGGEQQRVALARALAPQPHLLMLDEPLGALDRTLREQLIEEVRGVLHETGIPAIYVTHDQEEAFAFADQLVLLHEGQLEQSGPPYEVFNHPASAWVAQFFGQTNLIEGKVSSLSPLGVQTALGQFHGTTSQQVKKNPFRLGDPATVLLRPYGAGLVEKSDGINTIRGTVTDTVFRGEGFRVQLQAQAGGEFSFLLEHALQVGQDITLHILEEGVLVLKDGEGQGNE
jgi:spermidine/putrescine transport system ATP-binding protein